MTEHDLEGKKGLELYHRALLASSMNTFLGRARTSEFGNLTAHSPHAVSVPKKG